MLSIHAYGLGLIGLIAVLFGALVWYALAEVAHLDAEMRTSYAELAAAELNDTLQLGLQTADAVADEYAVWDETAQQFINPIYYAYWLQSRVPDAPFKPKFFDHLHLYNKTGGPLNSAEAHRSFPRLEPDSVGFWFVADGARELLYCVRKVESGGELLGYVAVAFDLAALLISTQRFRYIDVNSLQIRITDAGPQRVDALRKQISYTLVPNRGFNRLRAVTGDILQRFGFLVIVVALVIAYMLYVLIGTPLRRLARHIDVLSDGQLVPLHWSGPAITRVAEFEKLRNSLNDYITQLEDLERLATGHVEHRTGTSSAARGTLAAALNSLVGRLRRTMTEKDTIAAQLQRQADQLREATAQAHRANEAKSSFLANMSHEIRTPLTAIIGFAEASLDSDQSESDRLEAMQIIVRSGQHLLQILNDILDLSKVEANRLDVEHVQVSPFKLIKDVESITALSAAEKGLSFEVHYDFPLPAFIRTDPVRFKQVLLNLCSNAVKFTASGHVYLKVACEAATERFQVEVEDTGIGLSEAQQQKVFEPFVQADASTTRNYGGTGLGLALSRQLTERLGGVLSVTSKPQVGSRFRVVIATGSLQDVNWIEGLDQVPADEPTSEAVSSTPVLQGKVLLVEDMPENQRLISMYLSKAGLQVEVADNGRLALDCVRRSDFDLILMDMQMPVMGGLEATGRLRGLGCATPIVAMSANVSQEDRARCLEAGCDGYVSKPIRRKHFYLVIAGYLDGPKPLADPPADLRSDLLRDEADPELHRLVQAFVDQLPAKSKALRELLDRQEWAAFRESIHDLKGLGGSYGYDGLSLLAGQIESQLERGELFELNGLVAELDALCRRIVESFHLETLEDIG